jgi:mono/diheme cytochrome c family protein
MQSNNRKSLPLLLLFPILLFFVCIADAEATDIGAQLYLGNCAKCHGREGEGFLKLYPPIRNSRYLKEDVSKLPCIIRYGLKGEIVVEGQTFNQIMPAIQQLKAEQTSDILRFLQNKWNHPEIEPIISKWLENCSSN